MTRWLVYDNYVLVKKNVVFMYSISPVNLTCVSVQRAALEACHKGWGVSTIIGVAASGTGLVQFIYWCIKGTILYTWSGWRYTCIYLTWIGKVLTKQLHTVTK